MIRFDGYVHGQLRTSSWPDHEFNSLTPEQRAEVYEVIKVEDAHWTDIAVNKSRQFEITWWFAHRSWIPEEVIITVGDEMILGSGDLTVNKGIGNRYILDLQDKHLTRSQQGEQTIGPVSDELFNTLLPWVSVAEVIQKFKPGVRLYHEYNPQGTGSMHTSFTLLRFMLPIGQARELSALPGYFRELIRIPATAVAAKTLRQILEQYGEIIAWRLEDVGDQATLQVQLQLGTPKKYLRPPNNHEELYPGVRVTAVASENRMDVCNVDLIIALSDPQLAITLPPGNRIEYQDPATPDIHAIDYIDRIRSSAGADSIRVDEPPEGVSAVNIQIGRRRFGPIRPRSEIFDAFRQVLLDRQAGRLGFIQHFHAEELEILLIERHNMALSDWMVQEINQARSVLEAERRARRTVPQYSMPDISAVADPVYPDALNPNGLPHDVASDRPGISHRAGHNNLDPFDVTDANGNPLVTGNLPPNTRVLTVQIPTRAREASDNERVTDHANLIGLSGHSTQDTYSLHTDPDALLNLYSFRQITWELMKRPFRYLWNKLKRKYTVPETVIHENDMVTTPSGQVYSNQNVTALIGTAIRGAAQPGRTSLNRLFALEDALNEDRREGPSGHEAHREQYLMRLSRPELESMLRDERFTAHHEIIRQVLSGFAAETQS